MHFHRLPSVRRVFAALLVVVLAAGALLSPAPHLLAAQSGTSTIAYLRPNDDTGDEIHLIAPDGSNDRTLWSTGVADPQHVYDISGLAWRPDGTELAFDSSHENWCSINSADVYVVNVNGQGYRRITDAPACGARGSYPTGTVEVPVQNSSFDNFTGFVYFQGSTGVKMVSLPPGGSTTLTFENVADFGAGELQIAAMIVGNNRDIQLGTAVDVVAGGKVRTAVMSLYTPAVEWRAHSPTWRSDGTKVGYVLNFSSLRKMDPAPGPLDFGDDMVAVNEAELPDFVDFLTWGPTPATADQLLYVGNTAFADEGIFRISEGSTTPGEQLLSYEVYEQILGLAWLPDGSGFVFAKKNFSDMFTVKSADIFVYRFATKQATPITQFDGEFAGRLSVAPDGTQIVFERASALVEEFGSVLVDPELWVMNLDGSGLRLLVQHGRAPAWGVLNALQPNPTPNPTASPTPNPTVSPTPNPTPGPTPVPGTGGEAPLYLPLIKH
jgi:hypothetical protein